MQALAPDTNGNPGVWECQPGGWPVVNRPDTEFTYILSGRARRTDGAIGAVVEIGVGDLVILPPGWSGRWDVLETVRKVCAELVVLYFLRYADAHASRRSLRRGTVSD